MTDVTIYDEFYDQLMANYDELETVAKDKLDTEELISYGSIEVPSWTPGSVDGSFGDFSACEFEDSRSKLSTLGSTHIGGAYYSLSNMQYQMELAMRDLNGMEYTHRTLGGVDEHVTKIVEGLANWHKEDDDDPDSAAEVFKDKYVTTISQRKTKQYAAIQDSMRAAGTAMEIMTESRKRALELPLTAKKALEDYNPWSWLYWSGAKVAFVSIGIVAGKAGSILATIGDSNLPEHADLTTAGIMQQFRNAVDSFVQDKQDGEKEVAKLLDGYCDDIEESWSSYVCARPDFDLPSE